MSQIRIVNGYTIECGIPIPQAKRPPKGYPFTEMRVGESVFIDSHSPASIGGSVAYAGRKVGAKFVSRTDGTGVRVWRVSDDYDDESNDA